MRVLLYGMQSSGASVLAYTMAQRPESLAFVDIWNTFAAPVLEDCDRDIVAKVVVTTAFELETHRRRFRPDVTFLVLRHPADTYDSLFDKPYANENGLIDEKFALWEEVFRSGFGFDRVIYYEDFAFSPADILTLFKSIGWEMSDDALLLRRDQSQIERTNLSVYPDLHSRVRYGAGNLKPGSIVRDRVRFARPWGKTAHLPELCPAIFENYDAVRAERGMIWRTPSRAVLSCGLHAVLRELTGQGAIPQKADRLGYGLTFTGTPQSRITDGELILTAPPGRQETRLTLAGLPGRPFDRLRGIACAESPLCPGIELVVGIEDAAGKCLVEECLLLGHSSMRCIDMIFQPQGAPITMTVGTRLLEAAASPLHGGVRICDLRLEQAAQAT